MTPPPPNTDPSTTHCLPALQADLVPTDKPEKFDPDTVTQHLTDSDAAPNDDSSHPSRHYVQPRDGIDLDTLSSLFHRHDIDPASDTYLIHAGYTGEFAVALRSLAADVIFTDPIDHWVQKATENGFDAYQTTLEGCPEDLLAKVDGVATFEGYMPLESTDKLRYEGLRILSRPTGLLFCESEYPRSQMKETGKDFSLKRRFTPFDKAYEGINRHYRERHGLRLYHISATAATQEHIRRDIQLLTTVITLQDEHPEVFADPDDLIACHHQLTSDAIDMLCSEIDVEREAIYDSLDRLRTLTWESLGQLQTYSDSRVVDVAEVRFGLPDFMGRLA